MQNTTTMLDPKTYSDSGISPIIIAATSLKASTETMNNMDFDRFRAVPNVSLENLA